LGSGVTLQATGGDTYAWSPAVFLDDPSLSNPTATPDVTTQFSVHISESICNYDTTIAVLVTVNPSPVVRAEKSNDIDCSVPTAQLTASGAASYTWAPATGLDFADRHNPVASIDTTTTFIVTGSNQFGCIATAQVNIKVTKENIPINAVPNAFTPNHDGHNDCFGIRKWGAVTLIEFSIFNRWGQKIFTTKNPSQCWDGTFNGKQQDTGGYAYVIRARTLCGEVKRTGIVMLIR
jgi:gliding motility-associated-like protein